MALNDDLSADLDTLQSVVTDVITAYQAVVAANKDLAAQIAAAGANGLTADQLTTVQSRFAAIEQSMKDAITPATGTPPAPTA
jgi:hypothetical protein